MDEQKSQDGQGETTARVIPINDVVAPTVNDVTPPPASKSITVSDDEQHDDERANETGENSDQSEDSSNEADEGVVDQVEQSTNDAPEVDSSSSEAVDEHTVDNEVEDTTPELVSNEGVVEAPAEQSESTDEEVEQSSDATDVDNQSGMDEPSTTQSEAVLGADISNEQSASPSNMYQQSATNEKMAEVGVAASQMNKPPHRNNKKFAAVVTIIVAILLAGVAVFVYMSANENAEEDTTGASDTSNQVSNEPEVLPATSEDVDATTAAVDEAVNALDEAADFAETDLSDTSLGL